MYDELCDEELVKKAGGHFKLTTLIQKRLVALMQGAEPLVQLNTDDRMKIVIQEILQDKIHLDVEHKVRTVADQPGPPDVGFADL